MISDIIPDSIPISGHTLLVKQKDFCFWKKEGNLEELIFNDDIKEWCKQNIGGNYSILSVYGARDAHVFFTSDEDAIMFKMRWC